MKLQFLTLLLFTLFSFFSYSVGNWNNRNKNIDTIRTYIGETGIPIAIVFEKGDYFNHPTFAFWIESVEGYFLKNIFVTKSISTGIFKFGPIDSLSWGRLPGQAKRPAALPYWLHKAVDGKLPSPSNPLPDVYTGVTPHNNFLILSNIGDYTKFNLLLEINQTWDWNEYWTNDLFPDVDYKHSSQPSLVYSVTIDLQSGVNEYYMNPIGHGHYAGKNGLLYTDLSTFTTALKIVKKIKIIVGN
ncbi:MAG: hypothetical protein SNJ71_03700 [Bacteroidales bacterium]